MRVSEGLGRIGGLLMAPAFAGGSLLRRARVFHPEGLVFRAHVTPTTERGHLYEAARRLEGPALVRLSNAWWKHGREWRDLLGFAVRFGDEPLGVHEGPGDQDLLFATLRSPWTTVLATLTTNTHDFLANDYYAVTPFDIEGFGRARLRIVSPRIDLPQGDRATRLERAVAGGMARFWLELKPARGAIHWRPLAEIALQEEVEVAQESLRFSPFNDARGFHPTGFVHALRKAAYPASQKSRALFTGGHYPSSLPRL